MVRLVIVLCKFIVGFILLLNMDVDPTYYSSSHLFQVSGVDFPIDLPAYTNVSSVSDLYERRLWALLAIGRTYRDEYRDPGNVISTPLLNSTRRSSCPEVCDRCFCYEMDLLRTNLYDRRLPDIDVTGQDFMTIYRSPFYHFRVVALPEWNENGTEGCKLYGCGNGVVLICARNGQTEGGSVINVCKDHQLSMMLMIQCTSRCVLRDSSTRMVMRRADSHSME